MKKYRLILRVLFLSARIVASILDASFFILLIPVFAFQTLISRNTLTPFEGVNVLRFIEGGPLQDIYKKFQSLDIYLLHQIKGFTNIVVGSNYGTNNNFSINFAPNYYLMETTYLPFYPLLSNIYFLIRHLKVIRKHNISIIHSNSPYFLGVLALILARVTSRPVCVSIHADYEKSEALQGNVIPRILGSIALARYVERFVYRHVDLVLPIRESMMKHIVKTGCPEDKIRLFPHGIDLSFFEKDSEIDIREYFNIPKESKIISSAGRIERENYADDIVEIAVKSSQKADDLYFIICGDGSQLENLKSRVFKQHLDAKIIFPGYVPQNVTCELRKQSDVNLCLMAGFSLIEACASGVPVVSYDVAWHYELVKDNDTGFLIPENNIMQVVEKIEFILKHPVKANEMGQNAKKLVFNNHSLEATNKIKADVYLELLGAK